MKVHNDNIQQIGAELTKAINDGFQSLVNVLARMLSAMYNQHALQQNLDSKYDVKEEHSVNGYGAQEYNGDGEHQLKEEEQEQICGENEEEQFVLAGELLEDDADEYDEEYLAEFLQGDFEPEEFSKE